MKKILYTAYSQLEMLFCDNRMLSLILLVFFIDQQIATGMCDEAMKFGGKLNLLEPFIAVSGTMWLQIVIPVVYLIIMFDFPSRYGGRIYILIRSGRYEWYNSQILFSVICAIFYVMFITAVSMLLCIGQLSVSGTWSDVIKFYGTQITDYTVYIKPSTFYQGQLMEVFGYEFVLMVANMVLVNMIQLCLFSYNFRKTAVFICAGIEIIGAVVAFITRSIKWVFPTANTVFSMHFTDYVSKEQYPVYVSILYFVVIIVILYICGINGISKAQLADKIEG